MKTFMPTKESVKETWYLVDAEDQILGRLAARIARVLRGKNSPEFAPHVNPHNHVVVINASKIKITGNKLKQKTYYRHTGYPGGIKSITLEKVMQKNPGEAIQRAVKGMLPVNRLRAPLLKGLRVFNGPEHRHQAQNPQQLSLRTREVRKEP
jgi:large subunit ribosomal protein L13